MSSGGQAGSVAGTASATAGTSSAGGMESSGGAPGSSTAGFNVVIDGGESPDVAVSPSGQFALGLVSLSAGFDFGAPTAPLDNMGGSDGYIASFQADGTPTWAVRVGGTDNDSIAAVAFDPSGDLVATGVINWSHESAFVQKFDARGATLWSKSFAGASAGDVTVAGDGSIGVVGTFYQGTVAFDSCSIEGGEGLHTFIAKLSEHGDCVWARAFEGHHNVPTGVAVDSGGNVVVVGSFGGHIDFGAGLVQAQSSADLFVAKFSASGQLQFAHTYSATGGVEANGVAIDENDNILIAGSLDGAPFGSDNIIGAGDTYVAKFDSQGNALWAKLLESVGGHGQASDIAVSASGNVVVTGDYSGTLLGNETPGYEDFDAFVVELTHEGTPVWIKTAGGVNTPYNPQSGRSIATGADGTIIAAGSFGNTIDFGDGPLSRDDSTNAFVMKLAP